MFHKAVNLTFQKGTSFDVLFQDGITKRYDISNLFNKYPQLKALNDRTLFLQGKLMSGYGIIWNDELDIETETIYEDGETISKNKSPVHLLVANAVSAARAKCGLSQKELSNLTGIDQSDISKIERGLSNPSISTLERIAKALGGNLSIDILFPTPAA